MAAGDVERQSSVCLLNDLQFRFLRSVIYKFWLLRKLEYADSESEPWKELSQVFGKPISTTKKKKKNSDER